MGVNNFKSFNQVSETEFSVVDATGITHNINITRTDGKIESVTYDGVGVSLDYSGNDLVKFDEGIIDISQYTGFSPEGSVTFTSNGNYNITSYSEAIVNVAGGSGNIGYEGIFYIGDEVKYKASCLARGSLSAPPPPGGNFKGWTPLPEEFSKPIIDFPYSITTDMSFKAVNNDNSFYQYVGEIGYTNTNTQQGIARIIVETGGSIYGGYWFKSPYYYIIIIMPGENLEVHHAVNVNSKNLKGKTFSYNNSIWSYLITSTAANGNLSIDTPYQDTFPVLYNVDPSVPYDDSKAVNLATTILNEHFQNT